MHGPGLRVRLLVACRCGVAKRRSRTPRRRTVPQVQAKVLDLRRCRTRRGELRASVGDAEPRDLCAAFGGEREERRRRGSGPSPEEEAVLLERVAPSRFRLRRVQKGGESTGLHAVRRDRSLGDRVSPHALSVRLQILLRLRHSECDLRLRGSPRPRLPLSRGSSSVHAAPQASGERGGRRLWSVARPEPCPVACDCAYACADCSQSAREARARESLRGTADRGETRQTGPARPADPGCCSPPTSVGDREVGGTEARRESRKQPVCSGGENEPERGVWRERREGG